MLPVRTSLKMGLLSHQCSGSHLRSNTMRLHRADQDSLRSLRSLWRLTLHPTFWLIRLTSTSPSVGFVNFVLGKINHYQDGCCQFKCYRLCVHTQHYVQTLNHLSLSVMKPKSQTLGCFSHLAGQNCINLHF